MLISNKFCCPPHILQNRGAVHFPIYQVWKIELNYSQVKDKFLITICRLLIILGAICNSVVEFRLPRKAGLDWIWMEYIRIAFVREAFHQKELPKACWPAQGTR